MKISDFNYKLQKNCSLVIINKKDVDNMFDFRLEKIEFENYKSYAGKQTLDFTTDRQFQDDITTERITFNRQYKKYKKIIGIWGKNASGKSSALEIINILRRNIDLIYLNNSNSNNINFSKYSDNGTWLEKYGPMNVQEMDNIWGFNYFNDPYKPFVITASFSTENMDFKYRNIETIDLKNSEKLGPKSTINEQIILEIEGKEQIVWESNKFHNNVRNVMEYILGLKKQDSGETWKKNVITNLMISSKNEVNVQDILLLIDNIEKIKEISDVLITFFYNSEVSLMNQRLGKEKSSLRIEQNLSFLRNVAKIPFEKMEKVVSGIVEFLDPNVSYVTLKTVMQGKRERVFLESMTNLNNNANFAEELSEGTLSFLDLMILLWVQELRRINIVSQYKGTKYLFIDELGQSWHTNLTSAFISFIASEYLGNTTLVFTSHDANIGDVIPVDSIYTINNEYNLVHMSDFVKSNGEKIRKEEKFSYKYLNEALDVFYTNPSLSGIDNLATLFNKDEK